MLHQPISSKASVRWSTRESCDLLAPCAPILTGFRRFRRHLLRRSPAGAARVAVPAESEGYGQDSENHPIHHSTVKPFFSRNNPRGRESLVWAYHVRIENRGGETFSCTTSRHWKKMTDNADIWREGARPGGWRAAGARPGEALRIQPAAPHCDASGIMVGSYEMETRGGDSFWWSAFRPSLDSPLNPVGSTEALRGSGQLEASRGPTDPSKKTKEKLMPEL